MMRKRRRGRSHIPAEIPISITQKLQVLEAPLENGALASLNLSRLELTLEPKQPDIGKAKVLLHEMFHIAQVGLVRGDLLPDLLPDRIIQEMSGQVFWMLTCAGLWNGIDPDEAMSFVETLGRIRGDLPDDMEPIEEILLDTELPAPLDEGEESTE